MHDALSVVDVQGNVVTDIVQIEQLSLMAKAVGARVESVDFKTSAHVAHYMAHPDAYRAALASLL
ncbi:hypothetical protein SPRG_06698 [Saprolegnia parasitica CBS 223.65]|uniref:Uncharacterized protein n=1 Tax=Saprolegnia parasitica (strain CBS 223.65) TaxID=695850 RepID=A0A067CCG0_SAPPC|nr:hypothetical protein SPRG_06698 [Saprolegnia parasitica CBS 223.65]KDO28459.1 hypothetical protein SPRG_06698 [Saprolegnia parasitica CBS 223.65]|eukprot:XP_012200899.1 hypothetical protein SPRG_06698 [Saprolegnia parasitica CBS 223.65]